MKFSRCCAFAFLLYVSSLYRTQSFDFDTCPSSVDNHLHVTYGSLAVECNTKYERTLVSPPPKITFSRAVQEKYYEILMIDPDAPSAENPKCRSWLHMILSDVKGSDLRNGISASGEGLHVITTYNPPTPPKGKGYHRYILAAFSHAEPLNLKDAITQRCHFDIDKFTETNKLRQAPDASNMFQTITN